MFVPIADTIEDVMQQSLPGLIDAVRISDIGQGTNPLRIVSMRALPDQPGDKECVPSSDPTPVTHRMPHRYPREEWIDQGTMELAQQAEKQRVAGKDMDQSGDYVVSSQLLSPPRPFIDALAELRDRCGIPGPTRTR